MEKSSNKIYIVAAVVLAIIAIPVLLLLPGVLGGMVYFHGTAN